MKRLRDYAVDEFPEIPVGLVLPNGREQDRNRRIYGVVRENAGGRATSFTQIGRFFGISCTRVIEIVNVMKRHIERHNAKVFSD